MEQYTAHIAAYPGAAKQGYAVEIAFRGTNRVRTMGSAPADAVLLDTYLTRDGGYEWSRFRDRLR